MFCFKKIKTAVLAISVMSLLAIGAIGCGDSTRNDQGVSFLFLGWFTEVDDEIIGVSTAASPISGQSTGSAESEAAFPSFSSQLSLMAGLKNNLIGQFIRVDRIFHEYYVPGASVNPPSTSSAIPSTLLPAADGNPVPPSTLPGSLDPDGGTLAADTDEAVGDVVFATTPLIPANVREFIVLNRSQFPEPPFVMVVTSVASGVTSAGNRFDSNPVEFEILIEPDVLIVPTPGTEVDAGALAEDEVFE